MLVAIRPGPRSKAGGHRSNPSGESSAGARATHLSELTGFGRCGAPGWPRTKGAFAPPARSCGDATGTGRAAPARRGAPACRSPCAARSRSAGRGASSSTSSASRVVFARIDAAEIAATSRSPLTMARAAAGERAGNGCRRRAPRRARRASASTARRIASSVACRMLSASISATSAHADRPGERCSRICGPRAPRAAAAEHLGVAQARDGPRGSRITAAATTGPASGPRPASSTPATRSCARTARLPAARRRSRPRRGARCPPQSAREVGEQRLQPPPRHGIVEEVERGLRDVASAVASSCRNSGTTKRPASTLGSPTQGSRACARTIHAVSRATR